MISEQLRSVLAGAEQMTQGGQDPVDAVSTSMGRLGVGIVHSYLVTPGRFILHPTLALRKLNPAERTNLQEGTASILMAHAGRYLHEYANLTPGSSINVGQFVDKLSPDLEEAGLPPIEKRSYQTFADQRGFTHTGVVEEWRARLRELLDGQTGSLKPLYERGENDFSKTDVYAAVWDYIARKGLGKIINYNLLSKKGELFEDALIYLHPRGSLQNLRKRYLAGQV